jgi:hypothetical protein
MSLEQLQRLMRAMKKESERIPENHAQDWPEKGNLRGI